MYWAKGGGWGGGSDGNKGGTEPAKDYILSYGNVNDNYCLWKDFTMHKRGQICI